ncbi:NRDE family protein [Labilibaculum sp.]|uniref:NRDE family protein n=1 Tax=Labilibaculum sp. TaxID=2060723 RepID=UPI002AA87F1E|nr:NRDE family protein [Labilibaculum sp.]MBN2598574.1 hypothetical protein [Marinifilaceae bacterium]
MCTLTYIPIGPDDFFFTTNRDENPKREAEFPKEYLIGESFVLYPKEKTAKGTWMMCHENDFALCLLNGAFEKHIYKPPYKKSRGVMVLEFLEFASTIDFLKYYDFSGMEPFTLLVLKYKDSRSLEEIRWDGETFHYRRLNSSKPNIWSSSTLYNKEAREMRQHWFDNWLGKCNNFSSEEILSFHKTTGKDDTFNGLVMNRNEKVKTLSITQIRRENKIVSMHHHDLKKNKSRYVCFSKKSLI